MQKQIDEVMGLVDDFALKTDAYQNGEASKDEMLAARSAVRAKLRELLPVWIDAKEKMPPACTDVIAYGRKYGDKQKRKRVFKTYISTRPHECVEDEEISHWMPLPKAPE